MYEKHVLQKIHHSMLRKKVRSKSGIRTRKGAAPEFFQSVKHTSEILPDDMLRCEAIGQIKCPDSIDMNPWVQKTRQNIC